MILFLLLLLLAGTMQSPAQDLKTTDKVRPDTLIRYTDGTFTGQSRASYTSEPYWGTVKFTLKNGYFTGIRFIIRDSAIHEIFDGNYEKHFLGNQVYIQQCRNDWNGVQVYPEKLSELQDINKIDALSGATWSYNIFKASVNEALKKAR